MAKEPRYMIQSQENAIRSALVAAEAGAAVAFALGAHGTRGGMIRESAEKSAYDTGALVPSLAVDLELIDAEQCLRHQSQLLTVYPWLSPDQSLRCTNHLAATISV